MEQNFLTKEEVAKKLRVTERTIRNWIKTKNMPAIKIGGMTLFGEAELMNWLQDQRTDKEPKQ